MRARRNSTGSLGSVEALDLLHDGIDDLFAKFAEDGYNIHLRTAKAFFRSAFEADSCPRETLESFEILAVTGKGSFGQVYKARHTDGRIVAIKSQDKVFAETNGIQDDAIRERKLLNAMECDTITKLLYAFQDRHNLYICTELAPYGDLFKTFITNVAAPIDERLAKFVAAQVVLALEYLQHSSILHRDLKPANMLLYEDGSVKLTDFGLAKILYGEPARTFKGTAAYTAPEIILRKEYSFGVDWWSLGVSIYELLCRRLPFCTHEEGRGSQLCHVIENALNIPDEFSEEARDLIKRLLEREPTKRLGALEGRALDVKAHPWFNEVDFLALHYRRNIRLEEMLPQNLQPAETEAATHVAISENLCKDDNAFAEF